MQVYRVVRELFVNREFKNNDKYAFGQQKMNFFFVNVCMYVEEWKWRG